MTLFETDFAYSQLNGNVELLCRLLTKFINEYDDAHNTVRSHLDAQALEPATLLVHTIKGVAGNLGMLALFEQAKTLEPACKSGTADAEQIQSFAQVLTATINELKLYIDAQQATQNEASAEAQPEAPTESLTHLLENNRFVSPQKLTHYLANIELNDAMKAQLTKAIQQLDYQSALAILRSIDA